jgi:hypothetical protein
MPFDKTLPSQEFVERQTIALAGVIEAQKSTAHRGDDFGLSSDHPAFGIRRGEVRDGQWTAVGPKDVTGAGAAWRHPVRFQRLTICSLSSPWTA